MTDTPQSRSLRRPLFLRIASLVLGCIIVGAVVYIVLKLTLLRDGNSPQANPPTPNLPTVGVEPVDDWPDLAINWQVGASSITMPAEDLPPVETLRVEIVRLEGLPKATFNPSRVLAPGETTEITLPGAGLPTFWLEVDFDTQAAPKITLTVMIDYKEPGSGPRVFQSSEAGRVIQVLMAEQQRLTAAGVAPTRLKALNKKIKEFKKLSSLFEKTRDQPAKVHYRIYTVDGEEERTLFQSGELSLSEKGEPFDMRQPGNGKAGQP